MKISICITLLNEEKTISVMIKALLDQSKKADEIIIVDGGSSDKTVEIIRHFQKKNRRIKLLIEKGNIAHGRNTSIELAKGDLIVLTDAGCTAHSKWLEKITDPFKNNNVDMVAGFYNMVGDSSLQKAVAPFQGVSPQRFESSRFLPSARSMAFRKKVWEEVGGFREKLDRAGEDTWFCFEVVKKGFRIIRVKDAIVDWKVPETLRESLYKFFNYAKGDAQIGIWRNPSQGVASHNIRILTIFGRYLIGSGLVVASFWIGWLPYLIILLLGLYIYFPVWKWRDVVTDIKVKFWLPVVQVTSDFAVMAGFISGLIKR